MLKIKDKIHNFSQPFFQDFHFFHNRFSKTFTYISYEISTQADGIKLRKFYLKQCNAKH